MRKNQLKRAEKGEGPRGTIGGTADNSGKQSCNTSSGKDYEVDARHTAAWMDGAKLTVKRVG
jgi:hypothetical protein